MFHQEPDHHHHGDEQEVHRVTPSSSTIRRTGRLLSPSMPMSSSTFPARPVEDVADRLRFVTDATQHSPACGRPFASLKN